MTFFRSVLSASLVACAALASAPGLAQDAVRAFTGARIIDGTGEAPIENGTLVVEDGRITAVGPEDSVNVPEGAERIDLSGRTVMPGIINTHAHAGGNAREKLARYARYGVTTVVSLGGENASHVAMREAQDTPSLRRARIYVAGPVLNPDSPEDAAEGVARLADMDVDWVKIRVDPAMGGMPRQVYSAVIENAHDRDLPLAAHMYTLEDTKGLLRSGADYMAHSVRDREVDQEVIDLLMENQVCLSPTLTREVSTYAYAETPAFFSEPFFRREADPAVIESLMAPEARERMARNEESGKQALAMAQRNLGILSNAGVRIAFGTDSGASPGRFVGYFEHMEMALMAEAGMDPMEIIVSATGDAALCMGLADNLGTLSPGKWADFLVLGANPLEDIANTRTLLSVWISGNRVPPE